MTLLIVHAAATWFMAGLIWTIQIVHYPLFRRVGPDAFPHYEAGHTTRIGALLAVPAPIEVLTAAALVWSRPAGVPMWLVLLGGTLLAAAWIMTALVQVPLHRRLSTDPAPAVMQRLTASNWWRTAAWTGRAAAAAVMLDLV